MSAFSINYGYPGAGKDMTFISVNVTGLTKGNTIRIYIRKASGTTAVFDEEYTATATTYSNFYYFEDIGLEMDTEYAINVHDGSDWIGAQTFITYYTPVVQISSYTTSTVTAAFSKLRSGTTYGVYITDAAYNLVVSSTFTAASSTATKTYSGLEADTKYLIEVFVNGTHSSAAAGYGGLGVYDIGFTTDSETAVSWTRTSTSLGTVTETYDASYSMGTYVLRRFSVKFAYSGTASFYTTGSCDTVGYLGTTTGYDSDTGEPSSYLVTDDDSGTSSNFLFSYDVTAGTTYYLWVRLYDGAKTGTVYVGIMPPDAVSWTQTSTSLGTLSADYSASYSLGEYVLRRFSVSFAYSGTATFYTTGSYDTVGYLGTATGYDSDAGEPTSYLTSNDDGGDSTNCSLSYSVTAGTTYYFWVRMYDGSDSGTVTVCIDAPAVVWAQSSTAIGTRTTSYSSSYTLEAYTLRRISVSFATSGTATFYTTGDYDTMGYLGTATGYSTSTGVPTTYLTSDDDSGDSLNCSISYEVTAGTTYYFWVRMYSGANSGTITICIDPPEAEWTVTDAAVLEKLKETYSDTPYVDVCTLIRYEVTFRYSGTATFYTANTSVSEDTLGYLTTTTAFDSSTGVPTSYLKKDDASGSYENFSITYEVEAGVTYYLWVRSSSGTGTFYAQVYIVPPEASGNGQWYVYDGSGWVQLDPYVYDGATWAELDPYLYHDSWD